MHIDPSGTIGGYPALYVREVLRKLQVRLRWGVEDLESAAALEPSHGRALIKGLRAEGLVEAVGRGRWAITQAGQTLSSASAAQPVTRTTAERALADFLNRVSEVNRDPYFLAKVSRVVLFGSMLRPEVQRLSDVDLAIELVPKEEDGKRARLLNQKRAEELAKKGESFRKFMSWERCWFWETRRYLKARSRVIALADYKVEKSFVLTVPRRFLLGEVEEWSPEPAVEPRRQRLPRRSLGCPF